jgi:hypothetical protein
MTRLEFLKGAAALASLAGCRTDVCWTGRANRRWYKGNLHTHTFWSDGKAFPEEAVAWYKSRGYNFLGLSDHNVFQDDTDRWTEIISDDEPFERPFNNGDIGYRYYPRVCRRYLETYAKAFPWAQTRTSAAGRTEVRLRTFAELSSRFNTPGEFLLMPDVEATRRVRYSDGRVHQLHMNYVNVPQILPSFLEKGFNRDVDDISLKDFLAAHAGEAASVAKSLGAPHVFVLNHPIWKWYDVGPEVIADNPAVRFFEVCNNGGEFAPASGLPADGLDTDRFWDVANAFRARRGQPLVYGIGTDDTHNYRGEPGRMLMPGNAWSLVRAESLDAASLVAAMNAGDFVTCEGLEPEDVSFDRASGTLSVSVPPGASERTVRFIVSKRDFSETPVGRMVVRPREHVGIVKYQREIAVYEGKVGMTARTATARPGEPICASYTMTQDDLYVRARIEERGATLCTAPLHPQGIRVAWTQPYANI